MKLKYILFSLLLISLHQLYAQTDIDTIILSAMKDEMARSMKELEKKDHDKPFFISYTVADIHRAQASAKYGALTSSNENKSKDWNVRVMVGDYELNDENFVSDVNQNQKNRVVYNMPWENDYMGIRLALWSQTDLVYNSAASLYKQKKLLIENKKVKEELLGKADFSKTDMVKLQIPTSESILNLSEIENRAKEISKEFNKYPELHSSGVSIKYVNAQVYFCNSENTEVVYPLSYYTINIFLSYIGSKDESFSRNLIYNNLSKSNLPNNSAIFKDIAFMLEDIKECEQLELYEDDYSGPVMFLGSAAVDVLENALFSNSKKLIASRKPLKRNDQYTPDLNYQPKKKNWKLEDKVIDNDITVVDYSRYSLLDKNEVWGNYKVDAEGVLPPDSLVLIANGILKTKFNDRTPADDIEKSNGHKRYALRGQGVSSSLSPGILKISASSTRTNEILKNKLIELAKEDGYEYGIIARPAPVKANNASIHLYKIDIATGEETRIRGASIGKINDREFKKIAGISNEHIVHNKIFNSSNSSINGLPSMPPIVGGVPVTYIAPSSLLLKRVEVEANNLRIPLKKPIVDSPFDSNK